MRICTTFTRSYLAMIVSILVPGMALSDVPDAQREEVDHLLEFVRDSACTIERNGKHYDGRNAYLHIKKKYGHFRDTIATTEDFIAYSATRSTVSGRYYSVTCGDQPPMRTQDWLLQELHDYRNQRT